MFRYSRSAAVAVVAITSACSASFGAQPARIVSHIRREPIPSSALSAAGYSKRLHIMEIEFCNGAVYRYLDVPPGVYRQFMSADSKARYYDWNIKGHYQSFRLQARDDQASR